MKRIGLMTVALALTVGLLQGGSCMIGTMGDGTQLWLHDGITLAGEAQVLEARNFDVVNDDGTISLVVSKIVQSAVGTGVAKSLIGATGRIIAAREREATRVTNSAAAKGGKAKGGEGGEANAEGGSANAEGGLGGEGGQGGEGGSAEADASADAYAEGGNADAYAEGGNADAEANAEATGIEINFPDDPCVTGDCD